MANFTDVQQSYVNKIKNQELKALVEDSYSVFTMPDDEKTDFVIWMSLIHNDSSAEKTILQTLKEEGSAVEKEISKPVKKITKTEYFKKEIQLISNDYKNLKNALNDLKKAGRIEKEKDVQEMDKKELDSLMAKLQKA